MSNQATLKLLYDFIESAFTDDGIGKGLPTRLVVSREQARIYARSFVGKRLASDDYGPVLDAIKGRW